MIIELKQISIVMEERYQFGEITLGMETTDNCGILKDDKVY
jgi:hypothetical protein